MRCLVIVFAFLLAGCALPSQTKEYCVGKPASTGTTGESMSGSNAASDDGKIHCEGARCSIPRKDLIVLLDAIESDQAEIAGLNGELLKLCGKRPI